MYRQHCINEDQLLCRSIFKNLISNPKLSGEKPYNRICIMCNIYKSFEPIHIHSHINSPYNTHIHSVVHTFIQCHRTIIQLQHTHTHRKLIDTDQKFLRQKNWQIFLEKDIQIRLKMEDEHIIPNFVKTWKGFYNKNLNRKKNFFCIMTSRVGEYSCPYIDINMLYRERLILSRNGRNLI